MPAGPRGTVYGLNGRRANSVIALSLGDYEHAIWKSRSFTAFFSWTSALRFIKPGLKSTQTSALTLPLIRGSGQTATNSGQLIRVYKLPW